MLQRYNYFEQMCNNIKYRKKKQQHKSVFSIKTCIYGH